jgi:hypothetical protein
MQKETLEETKNRVIFTVYMIIQILCMVLFYCVANVILCVINYRPSDFNHYYHAGKCVSSQAYEGYQVTAIIIRVMVYVIIITRSKHGKKYFLITECN